LEEDLKRAYERIRNGNDIQWIILFGHTPMYSSSDGHEGGNKSLKEEIEELLFKYSVNIALWGDDHVYERSFPIYKNAVDKSTLDSSGKFHIFSLPNLTIHLLVGTGGIDLDGWKSEEQPNWSAYREKVHGYLTMEISQSVCEVQFVRLKDGSIADTFSLVKPSSTYSVWSPGWFLIPASFFGIVYFVRIRKKRLRFNI